MNFLSEKTSITFHETTYAYNELRTMVNKLEQRLARLDISKETVVAVSLHRTPMLITSLLALLEMNVTFIPIDVNLPEKRVQNMISKAKAQIWIHDHKSMDGLINIDMRQDLCFEDIDIINSIESDIAYIMCTSGTTGQPKSVLVRRAGLENFLESVPRLIHFEQGLSISCLTSCSFDIFLLESVMATSIGLNIILADDEEAENAAYLVNLLKKANYVQMTPSKMNLIGMIDSDYECLRKVNAIMLGGEAFPESLLKTLRQKTTAKIYNMYGPVETTIWSSIADLTQSNSVHIGYPIANTEFYILNSTHEVLPDGRIGEIAISGAGLAAGYKDDIELTNQKFICLEDGTKVYLTGDLGKKNEDGSYSCGGRIDSQVKIRGFRVELEEIETCITQCFPNTLAACVFDEKNKQLISFYTGDNSVTSAEFNSVLAQHLPYYMIPNRYIKVDEIKHTTSYKIDRKAMLSLFSKMEEENSSNNNCEAENTLDIYETIAEVIECDAKIVDYGVKIADIGIDSIKLIMLIVALEEKYNISFEDKMLSRNAFYYCGEIFDYVNELVSKKEN